MNQDRVNIELSLAVDGHVRPVRCRVREAASEITHAVVEIAAHDDVDFDAALGSEATLTFTVGDASTRRFTLVVGAVEFTRVESGSYRYDVHLHARVWLLAHTRNTRKFQRLSAREIITKVLSAHGVAHAWQLTREPKVREYCVQYGESDLDFVARLLEFEGIFYSFDEDGTMVLADRSSAAPEVDQGRVFDLHDAAGALDRAELGVFAFRRTARVAPGRATVADFSMLDPKRRLSASRTAEREQALEVYEYPAGFRDPADGEVLAGLRLEALRAGASLVEGAGNAPTFAPGHRFAFSAAGGDAFAGDYFLVAVEHEARDADAFREGRDDEAAYRNTFRAVPAAIPFRPAVRTPRPSVAGSHTAMVRGPAGAEIHTDELGRFRAQFHWDREAQGTDQDSRWIRLLQETATSMTLARVGWEMSVAYLHGDPDRPVGFARNINGVMPPAYGQPGNRNTATIKTPSSPATGGYNELKLDDSAGAMLFSVRAEKDYTADVKNDKTETIGHDEAREINNDLTHAVGRDQTVSVGHDSTETIEKDRILQIQGNRTKTVGASETVDVGGSMTVATEKNETETVGSVRFTFAGGFKLPDLAARAKGIVKGVEGKAKGMGASAASAAMAGAASGAEGGLDAGGGAGGMASSIVAGAGSGAMEGATGSLTQSLSNLVPSASGVAGQLTGGLSDGISFDKIADQVLVGSIRRTATEKTSRTIGGAFISAGIGGFVTTVGKAYVETIGGLKLTISLTDGIAQAVDGQLVLTVGGMAMRSAVGDMTVSADTTLVTVGGALAFTSLEQVLVTSKQITIQAGASLDLQVSGAGLLLDAAGAHLRGAVQIKAGDSVVITGKNNYLSA